MAGGPFKFTVTSPYMLARTLLDRHYGDFEDLLMAIADVLAQQVAGLAVRLPAGGRSQHSRQSFGRPHCRGGHQPRAGWLRRERAAVHLCFGNYGGQTIQKGEWRALTDFLNRLHVDHLVLEMAHRPPADLDALKDVDPRIRLGIGVVDVKVNHVETPEEIARALERCRSRAGAGPRRLDSSGLRLLDAEALGGRSQDRGVGRRAATCTWGEHDRVSRSRHRRASLAGHRGAGHQPSDLLSAELVFSRRPRNVLHVLPDRRRRSYSRPRSIRAKRGKSPAGRPSIPFPRRCIPIGEALVFTRGGGLWTINRQTLAERCIVDQSGRRSWANAPSAAMASG